MASVEAAARAVNLTEFFKISSRGSLASEGLSVCNLLNFLLGGTTQALPFSTGISTKGREFRRSHSAES